MGHERVPKETALDVASGAEERAVGIRRQEAARLALQRAEARVPDAVLELERRWHPKTNTRKPARL